MRQRYILLAFLIAASTTLTGCGKLISAKVSGVVDGLSKAVMKQKDPDLVRDGAPAFLLMIDGMLEGNPKDERLLAGAAQIYGAYTAAFLVGKEPERAKILSDRAREYADRAMSVRNPTYAALHDKPYSAFTPVLETFTYDDVELLFLLVSSWATWIQAHADDWDAIAELPKVQGMTEALLKLDGDYFYGSPHLYMGVLHTLVPPAMGGRPEDGKAEFEKAIAVGKGRYLPAYVVYAKQYARMVFDRELHDDLLRRALAVPADIEPELTLVNTLARHEAQKLLDGADDYF